MSLLAATGANRGAATNVDMIYSDMRDAPDEETGDVL